MSDLNIWLGRKERALAVQNKQRLVWEDSIDLYNCKLFDKRIGVIDPERVDVHFVNWYVSNLIPLTYFRDPFIFIKPRDLDGMYAPFAETMEEAINYIWGELDLKHQFKKTILSAFLTPPGWIKLGYTAKVGEDIGNLDQIKEKSLIRDIKNAITGVFKKPSDKSPEEQGILDLNIKEESVFAKWLPSWNILMPPGYHDVNNMPWLIEIEDVSMVDFKLNPLYRNKDKAKAERSYNDKDTGQLRKPSYGGEIGGDDEENILRLYHVWDRRERRRFTFSTKEIHFEGKWPYNMEGFPYKHLIFEETLPQEDESNSYPVNAITPILPQVLEQASARTMMVKHRRRANAIILVQQGLYTEEQINQLEENEALQIIQVPSIQSVQSMTMPPLPPDVYNVDAIIKQDLQMATSMGQMMFQPQPGQRTATQASIAQQGLQLKAEARVDKVEDFTKLIARSLAQLMWQFYDREKISEIVGKEVTPSMWPDLPADERDRKRIIQAELQFRIDAGSTAPPKDESVDFKQTLDMISIIASFAPERLKKDEVVKILLKKKKFAKDLDKIVITSDEEELAAAEEENKLLAGGVPQVVGPNENHMLHMQSHEQSGIVNDSMDLHKIEHGKYMGIAQTPQEGDRRSPMQSTKPEIVRQGNTKEADIYQSTQNLGVSTGVEGV